MHFKDSVIQIIIFDKEKEPNIHIKRVIANLWKVFAKIRNITYTLIKKEKDYNAPNLWSQTM